MWGGHAVDEADQLTRAQAGSLLRRAARELGPYRRDLGLALSMAVLWTLTILAGPLLVRYAIDEGISQGRTGPLNVAVAGYVVAAGAGYVVFRVQIMALARAGEGFLRDLRRRVFDHLLRLSMPFYDREKAGVLVSRMTSDIDSLAELAQMGLFMFVVSALVLVVSFLVLAAVSWQLLAVVAVAIPPVVAASIKFQRDSNRAYLSVRDRIAGTLSSMQEGFAGVRVVQAFAREDVEVDRFRSHNRGLYDAHMRSVWVQSWYLPVIELAGLGTTALVVAVGGWLTIEGVVTVGTVTFFVLALGNLFEPINQLSQLFNMVQSAAAGLAKLFALLDTPVDLPERPGAVDLPGQGAIEVQAVDFAYGDGNPVLSGVDLRVEPGEKLALVGPTGAGKSTLAKLIARLYDPTAGRVCFGGVDLSDATSRSLRERIVVVPQEGFLFNASVRDNVRVARGDASDAEVERALDALGIRERFQALPEGLDTQVHERGARLSAGEKQLVSLARAALVDPAVLVLDEATSSLDPGTELVVEQALARLMEGRTVVVIAHRLSTAARADRVGVVEGGRLVELGAHQDLVDRDGAYTRLYRSWAGGLAAS